MEYTYALWLHTLQTEVFQEVLGLGLGSAVCIVIAINAHGRLCALLTFAIHTAGRPLYTRAHGRPICCTFLH